MKVSFSLVLFFFFLLCLTPPPAVAQRAQKVPKNHAEIKSSKDLSTPLFPSTEFIEKKIRWFRKLPQGKRTKLLLKLRRAATKVEDPYLNQLRNWASLARKKNGASHLPALKKKKKKKAKKKSSGRPRPKYDPFQELPFPYCFRYVFGKRRVEPFEPSWKQWKPRTSGEKALKARLSLEADEFALRALLRGYPPYLDLSLAGLLKDLDQDHRLDRFAFFLETYSKESFDFYQAMDETSRNEQSLFYYDSMILAWIRYCFKDQPALQKQLRKKSMAELRSTLFKSFISYRRYRGLREALALSLLLRPEDSFPENLERYDPKNPGDQYFTREESLMLLGLKDFKIAPFLQEIKKGLPKIQFPLFAHPNKQIQAVNTAYDRNMEKISRLRGTTDQYLKWCKGRLNAPFAKVASVVANELGK